MNRNSVTFQKRITIQSSACVGGALEGKGPLKDSFDLISSDSRFGMETWEKSEAEMVRICNEAAILKANLRPEHIDLTFSGDLTNQCCASTFGLKNLGIPHIGLYGACSTFVLSMGMAAMALECGLCNVALATASSHYSTAERQYRFPLEYGCQRTPTSQTTVTACGSVVLAIYHGKNVLVKEFLPGIIQDFGIKDANDMGAAMAPAAVDTLKRYLTARNKKTDDFDFIITGDLGVRGHQIFSELCEVEGIDSKNFLDCGKLIYQNDADIVHSGGSGCGCSASVFAGYLMSEFQEGKLNDILLIGTGALLNASTVLQKESIPGIAHLIRLKKEKSWES